jgi:hypothetical protein
MGMARTPYTESLKTTIANYMRDATIIHVRPWAHPIKVNVVRIIYIWKLNLNDRLRLFLWKIAWNILPTKERLSQLFNVNLDFSCLLYKIADDSLQHLFFGCIFVRIVWHHSFWPLDSTTFNFSSMVDWIKLIISPTNSLSIPLADCHRFQIFASVACDILWYYKNQAFHNGITFVAQNVSMHINKIALEHFQAW